MLNHKVNYDIIDVQLCNLLRAPPYWPIGNLFLWPQKVLICNVKHAVLFNHNYYAYIDHEDKKELEVHKKRKNFE